MFVPKNKNNNNKTKNMKTSKSFPDPRIKPMTSGTVVWCFNAWPLRHMNIRNVLTLYRSNSFNLNIETEPNLRDTHFNKVVFLCSNILV